MRKRARIIYNPTSGRELFKRELPGALIKLEKVGYKTSAYATEKIGDATLGAERAIHENYDILIATDGDRTLNEVVNGIAEKPNHPELGVIPMGTVNDFGRVLHISDDIIGALDVTIGDHSTRVDTGKINNRYSINLIAGEQLAQVSYETPSKLKSIVGLFAYYIKGFEMLLRMKAVDLRVEYDGNALQGEVLLFSLGLTSSMAGFEKLMPDAKLGDGYFTLIIVEKSDLAELSHIMTLASGGEHTKYPKVIYEKVKAISVSSFTDLQLSVDEKYSGKLPANSLNLKRHIDVFAPNDIVDEELINNGHVDDNLIGEQTEVMEYIVAGQEAHNLVPNLLILEVKSCKR